MKHRNRFARFTKKIGKGIYVEIRETIEIPSLIRKKEYKKAGYQIVDIFKMAGLTMIWVIPGGGVIVTMILKFSHRSRPSAFRPSREENLQSETERERA